MNDHPTVPVDNEILKKYKLNKADRAWASKKVERRISATQMNWTDFETKGRTVVSEISSELPTRFAERFPLFRQEVLDHTVKGRNRDSREGKFIAVYMIFLFVTFFMIFVGYFLPFLLVLFVGGWILHAVVSSNEKYSIPDVLPHALLESKQGWLDCMSELVREEATQQTRRIFYSSTSADSSELRASVRDAWSPLGPRPIAPNGELTPREAELYVTAYMKFYGATGVAETRYSRDGGIDAESDIFVAQVKHQSSRVGVKAIRETYAVAVAKGKTPLFFTKVGFSKEATLFANEVGMSLFTYLPHLKAENSLARRYLKHGMAT